MYTSILSATIHGLEAVPVCVEVDVSRGLPGFSMVGSLSSQVKESQDRVRTALHNSNISLPPRKVTVNLSPGDIKKTGTGFDLPIAAAMLEATGHLPPGGLEGILVAGEIGLDGAVRGVRGILAMTAKAKEIGCRACVVPKENLEEARMIHGIAVTGVENLGEFVEAVKKGRWEEETNLTVKTETGEEDFGPDFADIRGQASGKRAALLAAAGFHNLLLLGPPGSGKTMIAGRLPGLLPELSREEALELTGIYSVAGMLPKDRPWIDKRPFRSPHHTISPQALAGGGRIPQPGEITLAHRGVLFLDEFPEMSRTSLELLRQPLEEKQIRIARTGGRYCFPADFLLIAAMNPCPCGYFPDRNRCNCSETEVRRYLNRVSQPLLDRLDLCAETTPPTYKEFREKPENSPWTTRQMREMAFQAHERQQKRYREEAFSFNGEIPPEKIRQYCVTEEKGEQLLKEAFSGLGLSGRACNRILRVARTAADLEGSERIREEHLAEAIGYRSIDKQYWR
ncbi:MAG: YifB family Mg chelatase-like AAA ATPase [Clostridiales bacterium]|nr:YifB family Mg chelatase-like AAA ATPase [Clostridiales bacterium]